MIGVVLTLIGSLVSSATLVREKDSGTLEQLLMTPAEAWEILLAKIVPLFVLLMGDVLLAVSVGRLVFGVPFRGSLPIFLALSGLYVFVGIGVGILLATISKNTQSSTSLCSDRAGNAAERGRLGGALAACDRTFALCHNPVIRQGQSISQAAHLSVQSNDQ